LTVPVRRLAGKTGVANGDLMTFVERPISLALVIFILLVLMLPPAIRLLRARPPGIAASCKTNLEGKGRDECYRASTPFLTEG
jgi:TctA family transporter